MKDAKLSLRACGGHLNDACIFLQRREEEKMERKRKEREEEERKIKRKKLGKTASGQWVNLGYLETIVDMGFNRIRSVEALKRTNNDISRAIEVLQEELETGFIFFGEKNILTLIHFNCILIRHWFCWQFWWCRNCSGKRQRSLFTNRFVTFKHFFFC